LADYGKAEQNYKWGLALLEQNFGPTDQKIAGSLENLASLYNDMDRSAEAELDAKKALSIRKSVSLSDPNSLAQAQALLGQIELTLHNNSEAQKLFQNALETLDKNPQDNSDLSINFLNYLAQSYLLEKNYTQAQTYLEKSLDIAEKNFHTDDIQVANVMDLLADFFHNQGLDTKAQPLYTSAFKIDQRYVGSVYTYDSLPYLKRLAKAYFSIGDLKSAEGLWQKALKTEIDVYGPRHPRVALDLSQLAQVEWALGEKSKAKKDIHKSVEMLKSYFPNNHPLVVETQILLDKFEK
jgi:tetratricopeptide (TPR) repeat protein